GFRHGSRSPRSSPRLVSRLMAINVQSIPFAGQTTRVTSVSPRLPAFAVVFLTDVLALVLPTAFVHQHRWHAIAFVALAMVVLSLHGHYRSRISPMVAREAGALVGCCAIATVGAAVLAGPAAD